MDWALIRAILDFQLSDPLLFAVSNCEPDNPSSQISEVRICEVVLCIYIPNFSLFRPDSVSFVANNIYNTSTQNTKP